MPKFIIERQIPGIGLKSDDELQRIARESNRWLDELGPQIQWVHSYVTDDKLYCVYLASDEQIIRDHGRCGRFPIDRISQVRRIIDPTAAESPVTAAAAA